MERRTALTWLVHGGSATVALIVGVPTLIYAVSSQDEEEDVQNWVTVGPLRNFVPGTIRAAVAGEEVSPQANRVLRPGVYVWRVDEQEVIVFSRSCTDLGCPVNFDAGSECFFRPCHGGIFDKKGTPMAGPPDRPLYRYRVRIEDGELQIDLNSVPVVA